MLNEYIKSKIKSEEGKSFGFFLKNWRVVFVLSVGFLIMGVFSMSVLPREANPEVKVPVAVITTVWQGASPSSVETEITDVLEDKILDLSDLKKVSSESYPDMSLIVVEFVAEADIDSSIRKLKDKVDEAINLLPEDSENPEVTEIDLNNIPVITFSVSSPDNDEDLLKNISEKIADKIEVLSGVSRVEIIGDRDSEIKISLNHDKLYKYDISIDSVIFSLRDLNLKIPVGSLNVDKFEYNVKLQNSADKISDIGSIYVLSRKGEKYRLYDIADIEKRKEDFDVLSMIGRKGEPSAQSITLQVFKEADGNILEIAEKSKTIANDVIEEENLKKVRLDIVNDNSVFVKEDFDTLTKSGMQTLVLIAIIVSLVLSLRMTVVAVASIPLIFLISFIFLELFNQTLNSLTLFALILSLGLLIDTAVVIMEGFYDGLKRGLNSYNAALFSVSLYKKPVISGVLTTIAAFVPMFLVKGVIGEFMRILPITISIVLLSSLVVGLFFIPIYSYRFFRNIDLNKISKSRFLASGFFEFLTEKYTGFLNMVLSRSVFRKKIIFSVLSLFLASIFFIVFGFVKTSLFPLFDADYFLVNIETDPGMSLEYTAKEAKRVEKHIQEIPELKNYSLNIGTNMGLAQIDSSSIGRNSTNFAVFTVNLIEKTDRSRKSYEIVDEFREKISYIKDIKIRIEELEGGPPASSPIFLQVKGSDINVLNSTAELVKNKIAGIDGVYDINISSKQLPPRINLKVDKTKIDFYGLSVLDVSKYLRTALSGLKAFSIKDSYLGDDVDINLYFDKNYDKSVNQLLGIKIPYKNGFVSLSDLVDVNLEEEASNISHIDGERIVSVTAKNKDRVVVDIKKDIDKIIEDIDLPEGYEIVQTGEYEEQNEVFFDLYKSMIVAVILIFLIMVFQFNSFKQPFIVLSSVPLSFIGVVFGLFVLGVDLNFPAFLGVVSLSGIAVNDAIILIDRINENIKRRSMQIKDAVLEAGKSRLEPVIITTVTTVFGVIPLAFANEFWFGLSISIAFGLSFASFLTLVFIPMFYYVWVGKN